MKNTKKGRKLNGKTKKYKKGGQRRQENYSQSFITQTAGYNSLFNDIQKGGQVSPNPAPSSTLNIYSLDTISLRNSLQSYGDAIDALVDTAKTGVDIYTMPSGAPRTGGPSYLEMVNQYNTAKRLYDAVLNVSDKFSGPSGLYKTIYGSAAIFVPTPSRTNIAPAPQSGGQSAPAPAVLGLTPVRNLTLTQLQTVLNNLGNALFEAKNLSESSKSLFTTDAPLPEVPSSASIDYTAYSSFVSQRIASDSLFEALESTYDSFVGSDDFDGTNGVRGFYRSILGDQYRFRPTTSAPTPVSQRIDSSLTPVSSQP